MGPSRVLVTVVALIAALSTVRMTLHPPHTPTPASGRTRTAAATACPGRGGVKRKRWCRAAGWLRAECMDDVELDVEPSEEDAPKTDAARMSAVCTYGLIRVYTVRMSLTQYACSSSMFIPGRNKISLSVAPAAC